MANKVDNRNGGYQVFYLFGLSVAILSGIIFGFRDTHTPPWPFVTELLMMLLGFLFLVIDLIRRRPVGIHLVGLGVNGLLLCVVVAMALV